MSTTTCVLIPANVEEGLLSESSKLTKALWWSTMTDSAVLRKRIVDHGSRDARERIAHIFYEMLVRYRIVAETTDDSLPFLMTQEDFSHATGMTPMHVSRTLAQLREGGLIDLKGKVLTILDPPRLKEAAKFNANYLHLIQTEGRDKEVSDGAGDLVSPSSHGVIHTTVEKVKSAFKKE